MTDLSGKLRAHAADHGSVLPPGIELGAILCDLTLASRAPESSAGARDDLIERYRAALDRLPADDPDRDAFALFTAEVPGTTSATSPALAVMSVPWARLAADVRAALPDGPISRVTAVAFESLAETARKEAGVFPLLSTLASAASGKPREIDSVIGQLRAYLAAEPAGSAGEPDGEGYSMRGRLTGVLDLLVAVRAARSGDRAATDEAIGTLVRAHAEHAEPSPQAGAVLGVAYLKDPARHPGERRLREEAALLSSLPRAEPGLGAILAIIAEFMTSARLLVDELDVTQIDRIAEQLRRLRELAGQGGPELAARIQPLTEVAEFLVRAVPAQHEAVLDGRAAEVSAELADQIRQRIAALPAGDPARDQLGLFVAMQLAGEARHRRETDPGRARELMTEADDLAAKAGSGPSAGSLLPNEFADLMRGIFDYTRAAVADPGSTATPLPPHPFHGGPRPEEIDQALAESGYSHAKVASMLNDPLIPVWLRVIKGLAAAFRVMTDPARTDQALSHAEMALELLARVTDRGADQRSAELAISVSASESARAFVSVVLSMEHVVGAPRDLAGAVRGERPVPGMTVPAAIATGPHVDRAAALLERGRGMLLARQMESRAELGDLRQAHPGLAGEFERLTAQLAADPRALARMRPDDRPPAAGLDDWARLTRLRVSGEYDALIARIRADERFGDFLRAPSADRMRQLAAEGPVVMLNHPPAGIFGQDLPAALIPHALVVTAGAITSLRLDASPALVTEMAWRMRQALTAINARGRDRPEPGQLVSAGETVREILSWTWHTIVGPVLDVAGLPSSAAGGWQRIWWVPTGPFNALPLHAAECALPGCERGGCGAALESVVSSYVPGFRVLAHARASAAARRADAGRRGLLVAASAAGLQVAASDTVLTGEAATSDAVLAALPDATHVHFGCHASSDPKEPSGSVLYLPSGEPLPVLRIVRVQPRAARLAFLAACGTSRTSQRLPDESIHLTSAFLLAGFPETIGTLWEIDDADARLVAADFLAAVSDGALSPARALHQVIRNQRRAHPSRAHAWASYVHAGA